MQILGLLDSVRFSFSLSSSRYNPASSLNPDPSVCSTWNKGYFAMPPKPPSSSASSSSASSSAPAKSRLGRGLNSLIKVSIPSPAPVAADSTSPASGPSAGKVVETKAASIQEGAVNEVAVEAIVPNPHQPRRTFTEANLRELADSIRSNGIIQPLVVRRLPSPPTGGGASPKYELIAGERRLRAAKLAGLATVPAHVKDVDALTQAQMALVENIQREDLNPIERAQGYRTLLTQLGLTQSELAARLGEERSTIANFVRLLDLAAPVQYLLREGTLTLGHAKLLAGVADILEQERLAKLVIDQQLSVRNLEKVIADKNSGGSKPPAANATASAKAGRDAHYAELEKSITRELGMRAQLKGAGSKGKGKLTLHYANLDQFDSLMSKLGVNLD